MRLAEMVIGADHATLEDREEVFGGVRVNVAHAASIFAKAVSNGAARIKLAAHVLIDAAVVGHKPARAINVGDEHRAKRLGVDVGDMEGTGATVALDQSDNSLLALGTVDASALMGVLVAFQSAAT